MGKPNNNKKPAKAKPDFKKQKGNQRGCRNEETNEMGQSTRNDIAWYAHYPALTANAGKLSMLYPAGQKIAFLNKAGFTSGSTTIKLTEGTHDIPGVAALEYIPSYGYSNSIKSPLTQMSRTAFNNLVAATNRVPSYEYTDLTMYQIAMTNLIQFYYWMCRVYLVAGTYSATNLTWNKAMFSALNVDGTDIISNRSLLYSYIINFAHRISAFPFPKSFDLFSRTAQLVSNIYADAESPKAQLYVFVPMGVYKWAVDGSTGSKLVYTQYQDNIKYAQIVALGNELLDAMQGSTDIQLMTSDILKVYSSELVSVNLPPENGTISAVYDPMMLTQIMNANWLGITNPKNEMENLDITQATDTGVLEPYLVATPQAKTNVEGLISTSLKHMVNFLVPDPSEGTVVEGTRFQFTGIGSSENKIALQSFGSEIMTNICIIVAADKTPNSTFTKLNVGPVARMGTTNFSRIVTALTCFDWHPRVAVITGSSPDYTYMGSIWDCSNYAFITDEQIQLMNEAALFNLMRAFG